MAYAFNGTTQSLSVSSLVASTYASTVALRFYPERFTVAEVLTAARSKTSGTPIFASLTNRGDLAGDPLQSATRNDSNVLDTINSSVTPAANAWNLAAAALASATSRTLYLNDNAGVVSTVNVAAPFSVTDTSIGAQWTTGPVALTGQFQGRICEVAFWSVALNADEAGSLSKGFKPTRIRPQSLVFYAPLVRNLQDVKGGLTLTNNNSATVADHPRVY